MSTPWIVAVVLQGLATAALTVIVLSLVRQLGVIAIRLNPSAGMQTDDGPGPGTELVAQEVPLLGSGFVSVGGQRPRPSLVVFLSPDCGICNTVAEHVKVLAREYSETLDLMIVLSTTPRVGREYVRDHGFEKLPVVLKQNFPANYGIHTTPYALAVTREGTAAGRGVPNALEHLEELVAKADSFDPDAEGAYVRDLKRMPMTQSEAAFAAEKE